MHEPGIFEGIDHAFYYSPHFEIYNFRRAWNFLSGVWFDDCCFSSDRRFNSAVSVDLPNEFVGLSTYSARLGSGDSVCLLAVMVFRRSNNEGALKLDTEA